MSKYRPTYDELVAQYKKLAKKADARLRNLEKLSQQEEFKSATKFAYRKAARSAAEWGGNPDKPRFDIAPPKKKQSLQAKISDIEQFLAADTSTKSGIESVYKKAAQTLSENPEFKKYGLNLTWDQLKTFFDSEIYKNLEKKYGSAAAVKAIARMKNRRMDVYKSIKRSQETNLITKDDDKFVKAAINRAINDYDDDVKKLLRQL